MLGKFGMLVTLTCLFAACVWAQGLTTQASKNDWEEINFEFNTAILSDGYPTLLYLADALHNHPGWHVKVEGNTDNLGSNRYNEKLGLARANTVRDFLVKYGATAGQIETTTRGKTNPEVQGFKRTYNKTDVARWMNRRVVLTVTDETGKLIPFPPVEPPKPPSQAEMPCCKDILDRLDKLTALLDRVLKDNDALRDELKKHQ